WAAALGVDLADEQDVYRRRERLSTVLGDRPVLVVLDDAWENEAAQTLRLSSMYAVHLLTTRNRAIARAFAGAQQQVHVPELDPDPAYELLERPAPEACAADPAAARRLVQTVGELPLAIEVLGGYLAGHDLTVFPDLAKDAFEALEDTKRRLAIATDRLGGQPGKRQTLEAAIRLSVEALPPKVATAFWSLGAFAPKPATFDRAAAQAVTQAEPGTLALLVGRNLVDAANGVLAVHQVVHDVMARALPGKAVEEHRGYYLGLVHEDREDWQRIEAVYAQVRFAWQQLVEDGKLSPRLFQFVGQLGAYQERRGIWQDKLAWCHQALAYAQTEMLVKEQASLLVHLGYGYSALGDKLQALDYYVQSLPLRRQVGDKGGEAITLLNAGVALWQLDDQAQAMERFEAFLQVCAMIDERVTTALGLGGWIAQIQGLFASNDSPQQD
ncbi:MAG: tetratricopeptide repeat protein, partial [Caldilineaceae bacterium]|nr:tetratricopeptide repeat protein [Caldilineaceae bacterium]